MEKKAKQGYYDFFYREMRIIFILLATLGFMGNGIDIVLNQQEGLNKLYLDYPLLIILPLLILMHFYFKISLKTCFIFGLYAIFANTALNIIIHDTGSNGFLAFFLRESIFILLMIISASLFISNKHAVFTGLIYLAIYIHVTITTKNEFLIENAVIMLIIVLSFISVVYLFSQFLERAISGLKARTQTVEGQNFTITSINKLLTGSHFRIHEQNRQLKELNQDLEQKTNELNDLNKQLNRKNIELLKRENELSAVNLDKDRFLSILAHDMKNHLNTLIGFSSLMVLEVDNVSNKKLNTYSLIVNRTGKELHELLENLLYWSRVQMKGFTMNKEKINLYSKVASINSFLNTFAEKKSITLNNKIKSNVFLYSDEEMLTIILRNLISNAIKYTSQGGIVIIENIKGPVKDKTRIQVRDSGIGMSKEKAKSIFNENSNPSTKGTDGEKGTGLGLKLCREFVQKHGEEIGVVSAPGTGSTFWFDMPLFRE